MSERIGLPRAADASAAAIAGAVGAAVFLFVFPRGALTTLAHEVLRLPGPGAGIVLVVGPFALALALGVAGDARRSGVALLTLLAFGMVEVLVRRLGGPAAEPKGGFDSPLFVAALAVAGAAADVALLLGRRLRPTPRNAIAAIAGNVVLLVFYWLVIFPRTTRWVAGGDVPLLLGVALAGGVVAALLARGGRRLYEAAIGRGLKEER